MTLSPPWKATFGALLLLVLLVLSRGCHAQQAKLEFDPQSLTRVEGSLKKCKPLPDGWFLCKELTMTFGAVAIKKKDGTTTTFPHFTSPGDAQPQDQSKVWSYTFDPKKCSEKLVYTGRDLIIGPLGRYVCHEVKVRPPR